ncbi:DNA-3-methyladenine glycosylase [candidate division WWE3 bacterium]|nr:DNA-3-methyladenine glycosylase [candidate division WWE3 bacterium]
MKQYPPLSREFYEQETVVVAQMLLGKNLVRQTEQGTMVTKIVETEAYLGEDDPASHAAVGKTSRTQISWGAPGHAYVYLIYGMYHCLNVVTRPDGISGCVLIRALEPIIGIDVMQSYRRGTSIPQLTNGPGKLCLALSITRHQNGADLTNPQSGLWISDQQNETFVIGTSARIGITKATDKELRFYIQHNSFVSK